MTSLADRNALVIGDSPIAAAVAAAFRDAGAATLLLVSCEDARPSIASAVVGRAIDVSVIDPTTDEGAHAVAAACSERWSRLDAVFLGQAAMDFWQPDADDMAAWEQVMRVNVLSPLFVVRRLQPLLEASGSASVTFLSSIDGTLGNPSFPAYSVSKGALFPLTHVLAHDLARHGCRVNCIAGAAISQVGEAGLRPPMGVGSGSSILKLTPIARLGEPADIAGVALFLASEQAAYVSGTVIPVDGGRTAYTPGTGSRLQT
jgi:NAD(P)-dependent dehydrogenase (short-subunit alcohol dehydrogenase family)